MTKMLMADSKEVNSIFERIAATSSSNEKVAIIREGAKNFYFREIVYRALNPYLTYKMTGNIPEKGQETKTSIAISLIGSVFKKLDEFSAKRALTDKDKQDFTDLVQSGGPYFVKLINRVLNKDLRCGASVLTFRKAGEVFEILPVHQPMKGIDDFDKFYKCAKNRSNICWSYKLDGTRTWAVINLVGDSVLYLSSNGKEIPNFHCFDKELLKAAHNLYDEIRLQFFVLDGEVINADGDFSKQMSQFRRINEMDASGFRFRIFDILPTYAMDSLNFKERYLMLHKLKLPIWKVSDSYSQCSIIEHLSLQKSPKILAKEAIEKGLEGIMLKTWDHFYQKKRSNDWCKIKAIHTEDLPVIKKIEGTGKYAGKLGALVVMRGKIAVEVGSGFSDAEREEFWHSPPSCIEIKYQDVLPSGSLRFPVFVRVREDK